MNHVIALGIKAMLTFLILLIVLLTAGEYPFWNIAGLALIVTGAAYVVGDLFILKATNNAVSTLADVGLGALVIWAAGPFILNGPVSFFTALSAGVLIGAGEWFFHKYVINTVISKNPKVYS
ncbi:DUF2512 family protein [Salibacterium sp. K-3]